MAYQSGNAPYHGLASLMAMKGRYGDTELVHMSKPEVAALNASGKLTTNPSTGLPEAFNLNMQSVLPIALGIAGSVLLPAAAPTIFSGLSGAAIAGGLGTTAGSLLAGESPEQAVMKGAISGGVGYGLGSLTGAGSDIAAAEAAGKASLEPAVGSTTEALNAQLGELAGTEGLVPSLTAAQQEAATAGVDNLGYAKEYAATRLGQLGTYAPVAGGVVAGMLTPEQQEAQQVSSRPAPEYKSYEMTGGETKYTPTQQSALDIALGRQPRTQQLSPYGYRALAGGGKVHEGKVQGSGDGMSDDIAYKVDGGKPDMAMLSRDEYVLPADVVSMIGNGSSNAGADKIDSFVKNIRQKSFGTSKQQKKLSNSKGLSSLM